MVTAYCRSNADGRRAFWSRGVRCVVGGVQAQAEAGERAAKDIAAAKGAIHELHTKIKDIKTKAEQSELMVQDICRDIKQLDYAKRHLQTTITALKRLHMLVTAVDQLQIMSREKHYREAANLLDAVSQLLTHFEPYSEIARIKELRGTVTAVKKELTEEILQAFNRVGALARSVADLDEFQDASAGVGDFASLSEACLVVDALGSEAVKTQVTAIVGDQLVPYKTMPEFKTGGDASSLDQIERRFSWFRRTLREVEHRFDKTFPPRWRVPHSLCIEFLTQTRAQLHAVLQSGEAESENVTVLLKALQRSLVFEKEMSARFEGGSDEVTGAQAVLDERGQFVDPGSAEGIRRRYDLERAAKACQGPGNALAPSLVVGGTGLPRIVALLSSVFDPFMGPYIALERKNLEEMMEKYLREEKVGKDGALPVYTSSVQMVSFAGCQVHA